MHDSPAVVALRASIARGERSDTRSLHDEVCAVVDELKAAGWPPERVLVAVKQIADEAGLRPSAAVLSASRPLTDRDTKLVQIVQWCIERYYVRD